MPKLRSSPLKPAYPYVLNAGCAQAQGLAGWWPGDPGGGGKLWDQSGRGNHATLTGVAVPFTNTSGWAAGNGGGAALALDGTNDYATSFTQHQLGVMTVSAWINTNTVASGTRCIACDDDGTNTGWKLEVNRTAAKLSFVWTGTIVATSSTSLVVNTWYLATAVRSGTAGDWTLTLYLNGRADGSGTTATNPLNPAAGASQIGADQANGSRFFSGLIENVTVWNRALAPSEVWSLYQPTTRWQLRYQPGRTKWFIGQPAGGGSSVSVTAADSPSTSDAITRTGTFARTIADAPLTTDAFTRSCGFTRSISDAPTTTDAIARTISQPRTLSDSPSSADSVSRLFVGTRTLPDSPSTSDLVVRTLALPRSLSDSPTTSDTLSRTFAAFRILSDAPSTADAVVAFKGQSVTIADAPITTDAVTRTLAAARSVTDVASTTDAVTRTFVGVRTVADHPSTADVVRASTGQIVISPSILLTNNVQRNIGPVGEIQRAPITTGDIQRGVELTNDARSNA